MKFSEYEKGAAKTASFLDLDYLPLGLAEETGELIHEFARCKRKGVEMDIEALKSEVGDVLWMLSQIAIHHGFTLEEAAYGNLEKLYARSMLGAIHDKTNRVSP